jgi:hypothetical protein
MPFRSKHTLEAWLEEFRTTREGGALIRVLLQDGIDGADTGLVVVPLRNDSLEIYMQPVGPDDPRWAVSLEPRDLAAQLSASELHALAAELLVAAALCQFLEEKSVGHEETLGDHEQ